MKKKKRCKNYVGVSCIDGTCPIAIREGYEERGISITKDCALLGTEYCDKERRE